MSKKPTVRKPAARALRSAEPKVLRTSRPLSRLISNTRPAPAPEPAKAPAVESATAGPVLSPAQQLVRDAVRSYEDAAADKLARSADMKVAAARVKDATAAERDACGAFNASHNELESARQRLAKVLAEQMPGQLVKVGGKAVTAMAGALVEFPAAVVSL